MDISVIIPAFNECESLPELSAWIARVMQEHGYSYEVLIVDDGSTDGSWETIRALAGDDPHVHGLRFRRNYGKSAALYCGFERAEGEVVFTMDADLQDSPDELPEHDMNCGLKAYRKDVVKSIEVYGEMHRYIPYLAKNAGYTKIGEKPVVHAKRKYGKSKFGMNRFVNGFLDLQTLSFLTRFGKDPMHFFGYSGLLMFLVGFVMTVWIIVEKLVHQAHGLKFRPVTDQPLFYLALVAVILGVMLFLAGFLGEMVARSSADRNHYNISDEL